MLFTKQECELGSTYQYGIIDVVESGRDGKVRKVRVRYRNHNEKTDRITFRSARSLVVIHSIDEVNVMQELGEIAIQVDTEKHACSTRQ